MKGKTKKLFSFIYRNKGFFILIIVVSFIALFPVDEAHAAAWWDLEGRVKETAASTFTSAIEGLLSLGLSLLGTAFWFFGVLAFLSADLAMAILKWILSPDFIGNVGYTNPATNPMIGLGLQITQGFVNMVLILVLVFIAMATILNLAGYQTKKLLVTFVIVALLVNFAPVICGLIVDASNIVMNFFIQGMSPGENFFSRTESTFNDLKKEVWGNFKDREKLVNAVMKMATLGTVYIISALVYMIFAALFLARYIVIWILVILSPIAFASYVLPTTRSFWDFWIKQFLQWSIVGITCGFFLYLAEKFAETGINYLSNPGSTLGAAMMIHAVPIVFLGIGLVFGLQTSAIGASSIINMGKGLGKRGARAAGKKVGGGIKRRLVHNRATRKVAGGIVSGAQKVPFLRHAIPEDLRRVAETKPSLQEEQKGMDYMSTENIAKASVPGKFKTGRPFTKERATAGLLTAVNRGDADDWLRVAQERYKAGDTAELFKNEKFRKGTASLLRVAKNGGELNAITRGDPRFAEIAFAHGIGGYKKNPEKGINTKEDAIRKAVNEARAQHIKNWDPGALKDPAVAEAAMQKFDRNRWLKINDEVKGGQDAAHEGMGRAYNNFLTKHAEDLFDKNNQEKQDAYKEYLKRGNKGADPRYFKALDDKRMEQTGWQAPWDTKTGGGETSSTPGEAAGIQLTPGAKFEIEKAKEARGAKEGQEEEAEEETAKEKKKRQKEERRRQKKERKRPSGVSKRPPSPPAGTSKRS